MDPVLTALVFVFGFTLGAMGATVFTWHQLTSGTRGVRLPNGRVHMIPKE